jgi:hypothetical protein
MDSLEASPPLANELQLLASKAYGRGCSVAGTEMRLAKRNWQRLFPDLCPWTEVQVLDEDFFPTIAPSANGRS